MALVTTFATTPLTAALYPPDYQRKIEAWKRGEIDWDTGKPLSEEPSSTRNSLAYEKIESSKIHKMLIYLRLDNMPTLLAFMTLLGGTPQTSAPKLHPQRQVDNEELVPAVEDPLFVPKRPIEAHGVRLLELTERESSVMQVSELDEYSLHDPLVNTFRTFGRLHNLAVSGEVTVLPESSFPDALTAKASALDSDLLLLPWSESGSMSDLQTVSYDNTKTKYSTASYISFISSALQTAPCNAAVFLNKGFGGSSTLKQDKPGLFRSRSIISLTNTKHDTPQAPVADRSHHLFCPFIGGPDDRLAVRLVLQMAENPDVTATVVHFETDESYFARADGIAEAPPTSGPLARSQTSNTLSGKKASTAVVEQAPPAERDTVFFASLKNSIPVELAARVVFVTVSAASTPLKAVKQRAGEEVGQSPRNAGDLIVVGRNIGRTSAFAKESGGSNGDAERCLGFLGQELISSGMRASVMVVQAQEERFWKLH
jgi:hypothetical protein